MNCPYCGQPAKYGPNEQFYGRRYGKSYMCYYCLPCGAYVGTHQNTEKPLGTMANQELRDLRRKAHQAFDPIWQLGRLTRKQAYRRLANRMGLNTRAGEQIHIGESDVETCKKILTVLEKGICKWEGSK